MATETETPSGEQTPETPLAAPEAPASPPAEGQVTLSKAEHDRLQAEARTAKRRAQKLEEEQRERERKEREEAARAAGDFDTELAKGRAEREALERKLAERDTCDAIRDHISSLGYSGSKAAGLLKLIDVGNIPIVDGEPDGQSVEDAVAATIAQYGDLFALPAEPSGEEAAGGEQERRPMRRNPGPASPPDASKDATPPDYVSPEEYVATPHAVRMSPEFRARVAKSRPFWPNKVPATTFAVGQ